MGARVASVSFRVVGKRDIDAVSSNAVILGRAVVLVGAVLGDFVWDGPAVKEDAVIAVGNARKLDIIVEDAPFVAVELKSEGEGPARRLAFRLNTDEVVVAGPDHPLRFSEGAAPENTDGPRPYLHVRGEIGKGLEALIARPLYYELAEMAIGDGEEPLSVWSDGARFPLVPAA